MATRFILAHAEARRRALEAVKDAPPGFVVTISEPKRSLDQNAKFHAMIGDIVRAGIEWAGKRRTDDDWKALLVSGHAIATKQGGEVLAGLEGEVVFIRESTASMSKARGASLIDYVQAWGDLHGVRWSD